MLSITKKIKDKICFIEKFYGIRINKTEISHSLGLYGFLQYSNDPMDISYLAGIFDYFGLPFYENEEPRAFTADDYIVFIDKLFRKVQKAFDDGGRPSKEDIMIWFRLNYYWPKFYSEVEDKDYLSAIKFEIISCVCLGFRSSPLDSFVVQKGDIQYRLIYLLIIQMPSLKDNMSKLSRESGINKMTIKRLLPKVLNQLSVKNVALSDFESISNQNAYEYWGVDTESIDSMISYYKKCLSN